MTPEQIWVLGTLAALVVLLVFEVLPAGVTGLLTIAGLLLGNALLEDPILAGDAPFAGLIDKAVIAVGAMFVISAGVQRTGAVGIVSNLLVGKGDVKRRHYVLLLLFVMAASAFMNNTPLVLIFMPMVLGFAERLDRAPSKMLIPLSFISILGGMCTLIGTSTNIIVASSLDAVSEGRATLGMFDFLPMGAILAAVGAVWLLTIGPRLLPDRPFLGLNAARGIATEYMSEIELKEGSRLAGQSVAQAFPRRGDERPTVRVLQVIRGDVIHIATPDRVLQAGDVLLVKGDPTALILALRQDAVAVRAGDATDAADAPDARPVPMSLVEVVVTPGSRWVDRLVRDIRFRERYGIAVFAVQRHGTHLREKLDELRLKIGDILLVQGPPAKIRSLKTGESCLVVEGIHRAVPAREHVPVAIASLAFFLVMGLMAPGNIHEVALVSALIMVLGRALSAGEAYASLDWDVLFLLGGTLALGRAFSETGLAAEAARSVVAALGPMGSWAVIGGIFLFTAMITQILSNNAAAAIMTPLAWQAGTSFPGEGSPLPFVMAVAFGASCCFLTPIGYKTNLLVYGPGGYKFLDFARIGLPLTIAFCILATALLPVIYG